MTAEHYTVRRYRERNTQIRNARDAGATIDDLMAIFDLRRTQVYNIIKKPTSENNQGDS